MRLIKFRGKISVWYDKHFTHRRAIDLESYRAWMAEIGG